MICLDTSFIVELLRNRDAALKKLIELEEEFLVATRITVFEILFGIFLRGGFEKQKFSEAAAKILSNLMILELDELSSIRAAEIKSALVKTGGDLETTDCLIAGIMLAQNCKRIITKDKSHFERIKEIECVSY
ncbi:type II toxin-antitoxin system VapC family toxin [Candidatus Woesearchaeota archaeon]|nr:type II toxin-antitoxin system VapC family toxin [Candidatus Woesearchaeota archaeon]